jgi:hypothetical protein
MASDKKPTDIINMLTDESYVLVPSNVGPIVAFHGKRVDLRKVTREQADAMCADRGYHGILTKEAHEALQAEKKAKADAKAAATLKALNEASKELAKQQAEAQRLSGGK